MLPHVRGRELALPSVLFRIILAEYFDHVYPHMPVLKRKEKKRTDAEPGKSMTGLEWNRDLPIWPWSLSPPLSQWSVYLALPSDYLPSHYSYDATYVLKQLIPWSSDNDSCSKGKRNRAMQ